MEKISYKGKEGYFLTENEKKLLNETIRQFRDYRESTRTFQPRSVKA